MFAIGQARKTDPVDAHSVAVAALRTNGLRQVVVNDGSVALRMLIDHRDGLGRARTETISRLHHLPLELVPGARRRSCPPRRPAPCTTRSARRTSSDAPAASWPRS